MPPDDSPPENGTAQTPIGPSVAYASSDSSDPNRTVFEEVSPVSGDPRNNGSQATVAPPAVRFGAYELLGVVAKGGMGVVYKARDQALGRVVALKMLRAGALAAPEQIQRFYREAGMAARLSHAHIVPIHELGEHDGRHYFTMAFVSGGSLAQHLHRFAGEPRAAVTMIEKVARAVHYAHQNNILHRDLKPANILLAPASGGGGPVDPGGPPPEAGANWEPLVSDFGLAKLLDSDLELTQSGATVGTPPYMAPEQAASRSDRIGPATDVWALGVILYELLTGQRPFTGIDRQDTLNRICNSDPPTPRALQRKLDRSLEIIVLKCLEKDPARRYASAEALADDLGRWQRGESILARPEIWPRRAWRTLRRHSVLSMSMFLLGAALAVPVAFYLTRPPPPFAPITLIGENGSPEGFQLRTGAAATTISLAPEDKTFLVESKIVTLLELVPRPPRDQYRLRAEVLHVNSSDMGNVGIYFAYSQYALSHEIRHVFCELSFADVGKRAELYQNFLGKNIRLLKLNLRNYSDPGLGLGGSNDKVKGVEYTYLWERGPGQAKATWRPLTVEVTPQEIRVFLYRNLIGSLSHSQLAEKTVGLLADTPEMQEANVQFSCWGSIGLYVRQGAARFRNVVLEPIEE